MEIRNTRRLTHFGETGARSFKLKDLRHARKADAPAVLFLARRVPMRHMRRTTGDGMGESENAIVGVYRRPSQAEQAVRRLQRAGFDLQKLSVAGKEEYNGATAIGHYELGGGIKYWGRLEKFWGSLWGTLKGWAYFSVPGLGPVLVAGPLASWIVATLNNAAIFGELSVVGAGLHSIGISRDKIMACEDALRDGGYLVLACGTADEVYTAKEILESSSNLELAGGKS